MTREQVAIAKQEGIPFQLNMADGKSYVIKSAEDIIVRPTTVVFVDDQMDVVHVLPLLTVTGLTYLKGTKAE